MKTTTFSQLRNHAKEYFDLVESGETLEVYRHGEPIAIISPARSKAQKRWKKSRPFRIDGASLASAILEERG